MDSHIVCPNCKKSIVGNTIVAEAANNEGLDTQSVICDCGERITYWQITAQLRDQKTAGYRFQKWLRGLKHSQA